MNSIDIVLAAGTGTSAAEVQVEVLATTMQLRSVICPLSRREICSAPLESRAELKWTARCEAVRLWSGVIIVTPSSSGEAY